MDKCSFLPNIFGGKCDMVGIKITFYKLEREREREKVKFILVLLVVIYLIKEKCETEILRNYH